MANNQEITPQTDTGTAPYFDRMVLIRETVEAMEEARTALDQLANGEPENLAVPADARKRLQTAIADRNVLNEEFINATSDLLDHVPYYEPELDQFGNYKRHRTHRALSVARSAACYVMDLLAAEHAVGKIRKDRPE